MTEIGAINYEASFAVNDEGIVNRVIEKHEEIMDDIDDPREADLNQREVLREWREHPVLVEYNFWEYSLAVRLNPQEQDKVFVKVYQNVPMKYFHENWTDFAEEVLKIDEVEQLPKLEREYLDQVEKSVQALRDFIDKDAEDSNSE